jgi:hypothetical protein
MPPFERLKQSPNQPEPPAAALARVASSLRVIAGVLAAFPSRAPEAWNGPDRAKDLKDLQIACERLQEYARKVEEVAAVLAPDASSQ